VKLAPLTKLGVGLLVVMIWLELCTTYNSSSPVLTTTSIILCFNKHWLTQVQLENGHWNGERTNQHPTFVQAGCPSCHSTSSVKSTEGNDMGKFLKTCNKNVQFHLLVYRCRPGRQAEQHPWSVVVDRLVPCLDSLVWWCAGSSCTASDIKSHTQLTAADWSSNKHVTILQ